MFRIEDLRAGDFIDLENYYKDIVEGAEDLELITKFFDILVHEIPKTENEYTEIFKEYTKQIVEIKERFTWIYNPPQLQTSSEKEDSKNKDLILEFSEDYGGYIEIIYILCNGNLLNVKQVLEMKTIDFLFWGEYSIRKNIIENIK